MANELKPCPFCGGIAAISYNTVYGFIPWCTNEDCMLIDNTHGYETEQEAIEAWNKRVPQTVVNQHGENCTSITNCGTLNFSL